MCGRYTIKQPEDVEAMAARIAAKIERYLSHPRFNVSPSQTLPVISGGVSPALKEMRWGLVPYWETSDKPKMAPINARSEEAFTKGMFRQSIQRRRCAIPADGFYEWRKIDEKLKVPYHISRRDGSPFFFAGVYEEATDTRPETYLLFTCAANQLMAPIHNRMPAILREERIADWLKEGEISAKNFAETCSPYPAELLRAWPVSSIVGNPRNDSPECVVPVLESSAVAVPVPKKPKQQPPDELSLFPDSL